MLNKTNYQDAASQDEEIQILLRTVDEVCREIFQNELSSLNISDYDYTTDEATMELGLDTLLIHDLVEDYVTQILKNKKTFHAYIEGLKKAKAKNLSLNYTPLRELAHKNLGVAKNLRIKDAQKLLHELMTSNDLDYLSICLEALELCAIRLKPVVAHNMIQLMKSKNSI